jgi:hypothetical protein
MFSQSNQRAGRAKARPATKKRSRSREPLG